MSSRFRVEREEGSAAKLEFPIAHNYKLYNTNFQRQILISLYRFNNNGNREAVMCHQRYNNK